MSGPPCLVYVRHFETDCEYRAKLWPRSSLPHGHDHHLDVFRPMPMCVGNQLSWESRNNRSSRVLQPLRFAVCYDVHTCNNKYYSKAVCWMTQVSFLLFLIYMTSKWPFLLISKNSLWRFFFGPVEMCSDQLDSCSCRSECPAENKKFPEDCPSKDPDIIENPEVEKCKYEK